jgi:DNA-binding FadR family transcriptional regulator
MQLAPFQKMGLKSLHGKFQGNCMTIGRRSLQGPKAAPSNLHHRMAQAIGERILSGEFAPGTILPNEADWGRIYGASRTVVREAIKALTAKGLVMSKPKVGSRVEPKLRWNLLDRDVLDWHHAAMDKLAFVQSTQEARRFIEPGIAALAARKRTPAQTETLVAAALAMGKAKTLADFTATDIAFHEALLACANNDLLLPFGIVIEKALGSLFDFTTPRNPQPEQAVKLHQMIAKAVAAGDEAAASKAMHALLDNTDAIIGAKKPKKAQR